MKLSKGRTASNQILPDDKEAKNLNYLLFTFIPGSEAHPPRSHPLLTREKKKKIHTACCSTMDVLAGAV